MQTGRHMWDMANNRDCIKIRKMSETEKRVKAE